MLDDLKSLVEFASAQAEKLFRKQGVIYPLYHAITANGETVILTPPGRDKDLSVAIVKAWFVLNDIDRYVFIDEAWILDVRKSGQPIDEAKVHREGISNHPDRREIVMFAAENRRGELQTARRFILRPEHGKPTLSALVIDDMTGLQHSEGRMVGLLNRGK